ncbi:MAG: hypothetical protein R6V12_11255, partial [Candidatus Hydrogenedentota bacterium]
ECWDPLRNDITSLPFTRTSETEVQFNLTLEPLESVLLVFTPEQRHKPARIQETGTKPIRTIDLSQTRDANAPTSPGLSLQGCQWVWYPGENALTNAPPGIRYFRKHITLPAPSDIAFAQALVSADNAFTLFVNGKEIGGSAPGSESWRRPQKFDFGDALRGGNNVFAIAAENTSDETNPAGVIGRFEVRSTSGEVVAMFDIDDSWQASIQPRKNWNSSTDVSGEWVQAEEIATYGQAPWGRIAKTELRPAHPFESVFTLPENVDLAESRVCIEMEGVYEGARLTVNGAYAGGVIGAPYRLAITKHLKHGKNTILIEPYTPKDVRVAVYE